MKEKIVKVYMEPEEYEQAKELAKYYKSTVSKTMRNLFLNVYEMYQEEKNILEDSSSLLEQTTEIKQVPDNVLTLIQKPWSNAA